jgi:hypothetical protein
MMAAPTLRAARTAFGKSPARSALTACTTISFPAGTAAVWQDLFILTSGTPPTAPKEVVEAMSLRVLPSADGDIDKAADYYADRGGLDVGLRFLGSRSSACFTAHAI